MLWSILAELLYYTIYPALRAIHLRAKSWKPVLGVAVVASFGVIASQPLAPYFTSYGPELAWVVGLPAWLLGCQLAEAVKAGDVKAGDVVPAGRGSILAWRLAVVGGGWICSALEFHSPLHYPVTLSLFSWLVPVWLYKEISRRTLIPPRRWLEAAGLWSYSLYLMHPAAARLAATAMPTVDSVWVHWIVSCGTVFALCFAFYLAVERPSHWLARSAARRIASWDSLSKSVVVLK